MGVIVILGVILEAMVGVGVIRPLRADESTNGLKFGPLSSLL